MKKLIATGTSIESLENNLNAFYYSKHYKIDVNTLFISNSVLGEDKVKSLKLKVIETKYKGYALYQYSK